MNSPEYYFTENLRFLSTFCSIHCLEIKQNKPYKVRATDPLSLLTIIVKYALELRQRHRFSVVLCSFAACGKYFSLHC